MLFHNLFPNFFVFTPLLSLLTEIHYFCYDKYKLGKKV